MDRRQKILIGGGIGVGAGTFFGLQGEVHAEKPAPPTVDVEVPEQLELPVPIIIGEPTFDDGIDTPMTPEDQQAPSPTNFVLPINQPIDPEASSMQTTPAFVAQDNEDNFEILEAPVQTANQVSTPELPPSAQAISSGKEDHDQTAVQSEGELVEDLPTRNSSATRSDRPENVGPIRNQNSPEFQARANSNTAALASDSLPDIFPDVPANNLSSNNTESASVVISVPIGMSVSMDKLVVGPENVNANSTTNHPSATGTTPPIIHPESPRLGDDKFDNSARIISSTVENTNGQLDQATATQARAQLLDAPHVEANNDFTAPEQIITIPAPTVDMPYVVHPRTCKSELAGTQDAVMGLQYSIALYEVMLEEPLYQEYKDTVLEVGDMSSGDHKTHGKGNKLDLRSRTITSGPSESPDGPILNTLSPRYNQEFTIDFLTRSASAIRSDGRFLYQHMETSDREVVAAVNAAAGREVMVYVAGHQEHVHLDMGYGSEEGGDIATPNTTGNCEFIYNSMPQSMIDAVLLRRQAPPSQSQSQELYNSEIASFAPNTASDGYVSQDNLQGPQGFSGNGSGEINILSQAEAEPPTKLQLFHSLADIGRFATDNSLNMDQQGSVLTSDLNDTEISGGQISSVSQETGTIPSVNVDRLLSPTFVNYPVISVEQALAMSQRGEATPAVEMEDIYLYARSKGATQLEAITFTGIAGRESSFQAAVVGDNGKSFGLFQIMYFNGVEQRIKADNLNPAQAFDNMWELYQDAKSSGNPLSPWRSTVARELTSDSLYQAIGLVGEGQSEEFVRDKKALSARIVAMVPAMESKFQQFIQGQRA